MDEVVSASITQLYNSIIEFYGGTPAKYPFSPSTEKNNALYYKASSDNNDLIPVFINKTVLSHCSLTEDVEQYFKEINVALDRYLYATTNFVITTKMINYLSMQEYEKQEFKKIKLEGRIAFCRNKEMRPLLAVMIKEETVKFQLPISVKDMKLMRKLLDVCGDNYALLLENDKSGQFASVVGYINKDSEDAKSLPVLTIDGKLSWTFSAYGYSVKHYHGDYKIQEDNDTHNISAKIKELIGLEISDKTLDELKDKIQKHAHGALLIFMKNPAKAKELCKNQRGFEISPLSNRTTIKLTDDSNFEGMFAFLCRIDGALIFNSKGVLISIGTIVDGKAKIPGNHSRGSRYNSTVTFIDTYSTEKNPICALVFSEDGDINYIDKENCHQRLKS